MRDWHSLSLKQVFAELGTSSAGLARQEAELRLERYGANDLPAPPSRFWRRLVEPFKSLFVSVLLAAAAVSFIIGENLDGIVIMSIIGINLAIVYSQQQTTERVLKKLRSQSQPDTPVIRSGEVIRTAAAQLVPGDIILLSEGQAIPADARLVRADNLYADESALTGESLPSAKHNRPVAAAKSLPERSNTVYRGTYILSGSGQAVVVATGPATEIGRIAKLSAKPEPPSPMGQKIDLVVGRLIKILLAVSILVFALSLMRGVETAEALRYVMSLAVSVIPEDLPIALTVIVVLGMRRLAAQKALVRSMKALEDIGLVTVIATDKTGTLTKNNLEVVEFWSKVGDSQFKSAVAKAVDDSANAAEPFDAALREFSLGQSLSGQKMLKNFPFNQNQRLSGAAWQAGAAAPELYLKGSPEHLLAICRLARPDRQAAESQLRRMTAKGYRVVGIAKAKLAQLPPDLDNVSRLKPEFLGFTAFADELRPDSKAAIESARQAGVDVKMVTGDHFDTAFHIGKLLGISPRRQQVALGADLPAEEAALAEQLKSKTVLARILPEQKYKILQSLKSGGVTAMTGDGVNDVPALASAHVGIAMGSGNDIAKDAGDMVLVDNSFAVIIKAISASRAIYDNIRRMLYYLLSTSLGEVLLISGALVAALPLPLTAIMILWVNLVTATALVIPLGLEPPEEDHMSQPPRRPADPILDRLIVRRILLVGATIAGTVLIVFDALISAGYSLAYAQTVAFMMLVAAEWANVLNARSERFSVWRRLRTPNRGLWIGIALAVGLQLLVIAGPLRGVFGVEPVMASHLLAGALLSAVAVLATVEAHKFISRNFSAQN